ncbi:hypothetical protein [Paenibacillus sp. LHD-38]|uniref:hypothetical protein n=1 Tax=Paenibacillus sp. LHD-38 TaxID=3072143 RepID=UPI0028100CA3|nr:hypothetical protein [Paenibacillus sp. LHD-38]MDQ8738358.1 hypothetical protein [Paenibacillus sp. LHD-38]
MKPKTMNKTNKIRFIIAGAIVVIGIIIYGSMSLYSKINQVNELNGRLEEAAEVDNAEGTPTKSDQPSEQPEQTANAEETSIPESEPVPSAQPEDALQPSPTATLTPVPASDNVDKGQKPGEESTTSEDKAQMKKKIDASVNAKLQQLKSSCQASSNSLVKQIANELSNDKEATLATIQSKYLDKVFSAEAACDAKFNQLISNAQGEYQAAELSNQALPDWSSQYESAKATARADALAVIANSIN